MGSDGTMQNRVGECIERLEERFGSFPINQRTIGTSESNYEAVRERADAGTMDVYVRIHDDDGEVVHVHDEDNLSVSRCTKGTEESLAAIIDEAVATETGVDCTVDDVVRVTIAGINNEADPDAPTVYRLIVLVDAEYDGGTPDGAIWQSDDVAIPEYV